MGDSENSRSLPPVTRMGLLSGPKVWLTAQTASPAAADAAILALWREWFTACRKIERPYRVRRRAEARLAMASRS